MAEAKVMFEPLSTVTDANLGELRVEDYDAYFAEQYQKQVESGKAEGNPTQLHPVSQYQDKLAKIETTEPHSVLLHVPYAEFKQVIESFGRDHKEVERLLFECMPNLGTYAQASIQRVFSCFQEFHFG